MRMRQQIRTPIWPYVVVVLCLFLLSVLASQTWRSARMTTASNAAYPAPAPSADPITDSEQTTTNADRVSVRASTDTASTWSPATTTPTDLELTSPFTAETPRYVAPVTPGVGERISLDYSVKDAPALPSVQKLPEVPKTSSVPQSTSETQPELTLPLDPAIVQPENGQPEDVQPEDVQPESTEPSIVAIPEETHHVFPRSTLSADYEALAVHPQCRAWSEQARQLLDKIYQVDSLTSMDASKLLQQLMNHAHQAKRISEQTPSLTLRADILRVGYATLRRTELWSQTQRILTTGGDQETPVTTAKIAPALAAIEQRFIETGHTQDWRKYLLLDDVTRLTRTGDTSNCRQTARRILRRMESSKLTEKQVEVFQNPPFDAFSRELRQWANEPIDYVKLLQDIETYEQSRSTDDAAAIAGAYDVIRWSSHPEVQKFTELLNVHYRNSNVRVALTSQFLNRMLPDPQQFNEEVVDNISGADVYGTTRTLNQLQVVLVPDGNNWRIGLEAHGEVASDTAASKGPATFYNQGHARYHARKLLLIDRRGIRVWRAEATADSETELTGFETDYDGLPLIGWLARSVARQQHDDHYYDAKAESEAKIEQRATTRFDQEVHARLADAEKQLNQKLIQPFTKIDLNPTPLDLRTTEQRLIARYRLASDLQLGAHSPRPQAPGDSYLSVQVHESALNNTLSNLKLEGKRTDLRSLYKELLATFERSDLQVPDDIPDNVFVQFADEDAVRVKFEDGRVMLTLRFAELKSGRDFRCRNFAVRTYYVPDAQQLSANLVRDDGAIELSGEGMSNGKRVILRGVFNKVLSRGRPFNLVNKKLGENPRLRDVKVNQFVINDGWIGVAMGPAKAGDLEHLAKEKKPRVDR